MKRWFFCKVVTLDDNSRGPKIALYTDTFRAWISDNFDYCIGQCGLRSLAQTKLDNSDNVQVRNDPEIELMPEALLSLQWQAFGTSAREKAVAWLNAAGYDTQFVNSGVRIKDFLNTLINQHNTNINVEDGDVQDLV